MHALKTTLREYGYTRARLETSDQNIGHGFVVTGLWAGELAATEDTMLLVNDKLEDAGLLDLDWEIGEDAHGVLEFLTTPEPTGPRKFFATEVTIRILSEDAPWDGNLEWLSHDVTQGEYVGDFTSSVTVELSAEEMAEALVDAGSDPSFFNHEYVESVKETLATEGTRARFQSDLTRVRFRPQAWVNDHAVDVDVEEWQTDVWFVEADNEYPAQDAARENRDLDWLKLDWFAPDWVKDWTGPFEIEVLED